MRVGNQPARLIVWKMSLGALGLLLSAVVTYLIYDVQRINYKNESSRLAEDIKETERLLALASSLAPKGDGDLAAIDEAIMESGRRLADERRAFTVPSRSEYELGEQLFKARAADARILEVTSRGVLERDFYREHKYSILLAGTKNGIRSTIRKADRGPLLIAWTNAVNSRNAQGETVVDLDITIYSLIGGEASTAVPILPACRPYKESAVWLPWLKREIHESWEWRKSLCEQGAITPYRTTTTLRLAQIREHERSARVVREILYKNRPDNESLQLGK